MSELQPPAYEPSGAGRALGARRRARSGPVAVLLNGQARGATESVREAIASVVHQRHLFVSRVQDDAPRIAREVLRRGYPTVLVAGGDGTLTCFLGALVREHALIARAGATRRFPRLGVLKLGTGNSVASFLRASEPDGGGFLEDIRRVQRHDGVGTLPVDFLDVDGRFAPFAGLGWDGRIINDYEWVKTTLAHGPLSRIMTGPGGYFASLALRTLPYALTHETAVDCVVTNGGSCPAYRLDPTGAPSGEPVAPGEVLFQGAVTLACAGTVPFYGYDFRMFPFAARKPGFMHLRLTDMKAPEALVNLVGIWRGEYLREGVHDFWVREATLRFAAPMPLQVAGDVASERRELTLRVADAPIELVDFGATLN